MTISSAVMFGLALRNLERNSDLFGQKTSWGSSVDNLFPGVCVNERKKYILFMDVGVK